jgi:hypothetical protein
MGPLRTRLALAVAEIFLVLMRQRSENGAACLINDDQPGADRQNFQIEKSTSWDVRDRVCEDGDLGARVFVDTFPVHFGMAFGSGIARALLSIAKATQITKPPVA